MPPPNLALRSPRFTTPGLTHHSLDLNQFQLAVMWERTLQDLIRGLRANKKDESKFIAKAVDEIRNEIKSEDMELKAAAVLKLTYVRLVSLALIAYTLTFCLA